MTQQSDAQPSIEQMAEACIHACRDAGHKLQDKPCVYRHIISKLQAISDLERELSETADVVMERQNTIIHLNERIRGLELQVELRGKRLDKLEARLAAYEAPVSDEEVDSFSFTVAQAHPLADMNTVHKKALEAFLNLRKERQA